MRVWGVVDLDLDLDLDVNGICEDEWAGVYEYCNEP